MLQREVGRKETRIFPLYRRSGRQVIYVALDTELPGQLKIGIAVDGVYPGLVFTGFGIVQNDPGCPAMVHVGAQVQLRPFSRGYNWYRVQSRCGAPEYWCRPNGSD